MTATHVCFLQLKAGAWNWSNGWLRKDWMSTLKAKKIQRHSVSFSTRANADGTVTVVADINAKGFALVVR